MPIHTGFCNKCGDFEQIFLTFKEAEDAGDKVTCPNCGRKTNRNEFDMPAKFMGTFGAIENTSKSKRYSYKKSKGGEDGNRGSAC